MEVFGEEIATQLDFTEKAQSCIESCHDHHKTWSLMDMLFFAGLDEIITMYVKTNANPTVISFWVWSRAITNENLKYFCNAILTYLFSLMMLRVSVRRNFLHGKFTTRIFNFITLPPVSYVLSRNLKVQLHQYNSLIKFNLHKLFFPTSVFLSMERLKPLFFARNNPIYQKSLYYQRLVLL